MLDARIGQQQLFNGAEARAHVSRTSAADYDRLDRVTERDEIRSLIADDGARTRSTMPRNDEPRSKRFGLFVTTPEPVQRIASIG